MRITREADRVLRTGDFIGNPLIFPFDEGGEIPTYVQSDAGLYTIAEIKEKGWETNVQLLRREILGSFLKIVEVSTISPTNLKELQDFEFIISITLEEYLRVMKFSDTAIGEVKQSNFGNNPIFQVTSKGDDNIIYTTQSTGGAKPIQKRVGESNWGDLKPQGI